VRTGGNANEFMYLNSAINSAKGLFFTLNTLGLNYEADSFPQILARILEVFAGAEYLNQPDVIAVYQAVSARCRAR
jgi:hypothetical protein